MDRYFTQIKLTLSQSLSELLGNFMVENGCRGYIIEEDKKDRVILKGYLRERKKAKVLVEKIYKYAESLIGFHKENLEIKVELKRIKEEDWSKGWKETFKPNEVTDKIVIKPGWIKKRFPHKIVIELEPKMAFGTGEHSTTKMCLKALEKYIKPEDKVLDLGTGSGILAIASAKLGASHTLALDIDEEAISNAKENIIKNKVQKVVDLRLGTLEDSIPDDYFNLILANLTKTQMIELFDSMNRVLKKKGILILSGIQIEEKGEMEEYFCSKNILLKETLSDKEWIG
ncbi:MAG: 50S ribosomal protein L11 methyltransferase [Candidatus Zixiibacteriota bacterium]